MKKSLTLMLVVFFSACAGNIYAAPVPVEVLSSNFSISGSIAGLDWSVPRVPYYSSYAQSGSAPLADSVTYGMFNTGASAASAGGFSVSSGPMHSWVYTPAFFLFLQTHGDLEVLLVVRLRPVLM